MSLLIENVKQEHIPVLPKYWNLQEFTSQMFILIKGLEHKFTESTHCAASGYFGNVLSATEPRDSESDASHTSRDRHQQFTVLL